MQGTGAASKISSPVGHSRRLLRAPGTHTSGPGRRSQGAARSLRCRGRGALKTSVQRMSPQYERNLNKLFCMRFAMYINYAEHCCYGSKEARQYCHSRRGLGWVLGLGEEHQLDSLHGRDPPVGQRPASPEWAPRRIAPARHPEESRRCPKTRTSRHPAPASDAPAAPQGCESTAPLAACARRPS